MLLLDLYGRTMESRRLSPSVAFNVRAPSGGVLGLCPRIILIRVGCVDSITHAGLPTYLGAHYGFALDFVKVVGSGKRRTRLAWGTGI